MNLDQSITPFRDALRTKRETLRETASSGRGVIGYFCTYTPIEIIHASGFLPVRIWGDQVRVEKAYTLVPNFICPYMRQSLELALGGGYDFLSGIVQGYTCDVACGMVNIWKENITGMLFHSVPLPYNDTDDSREFFRHGVAELVEKLTSIGGNFDSGSLEHSIELYGRIRERVLALENLRSTGMLPIGAEAFSTILRAGVISDPEDYLRMLETLGDSLGEGQGRSGGGLPVMVSGSLIEDQAILGLIEELGGNIVADDLCTGVRNVFPPYGQGNDPLDRLIDRYMQRFPCPARAKPGRRASLVADLVRTSGARGVIFVFQKFCTPHLADHPIVSAALKEEGIPTILIELEEEGIMEGQIRTRLETFIGMLGG
ncbi:MAG: 2-hydroxyacyl-CoA dehydratase subunit D [Desulfomonilia bacterium]